MEKFLFFCWHKCFLPFFTPPTPTTSLLLQHVSKMNERESEWVRSEMCNLRLAKVLRAHFYDFLVDRYGSYILSHLMLNLMCVYMWRAINFCNSPWNKQANDVGNSIFSYVFICYKNSISLWSHGYWILLGINILYRYGGQ